MFLLDMKYISTYNFHHFLLIKLPLHCHHQDVFRNQINQKKAFTEHN